MKNLLPLLIPAFVLFGCSSSTVTMALNSNDSTTSSALSNGTPATDLTGVQHVNVTVTEVDAHVAGSGQESHPAADAGTPGSDPDQVNGDEVSDTDSEWTVVSNKTQTVDLMTVRGTATQALGTASIPSGKLTQVRLKLQTDGDAGNGNDVIKGAVVDADGSTCDLIVPHSATNPGIKIIGMFHASQLSGGTAYNVVVNLPLNNSTRVSSTTTTTGASACAFQLNPVIHIESCNEDHSGTRAPTSH